jgi:hypothetical protein
MPIITDYFLQAELSMACYSQLANGTPDVQALTNENAAGMSSAQAARLKENRGHERK